MGSKDATRRIENEKRIDNFVKKLSGDRFADLIKEEQRYWVADFNFFEKEDTEGDEDGRIGAEKYCKALLQFSHKRCLLLQNLVFVIERLYLYHDLDFQYIRTVYESLPLEQVACSSLDELYELGEIGVDGLERDLIGDWSTFEDAVYSQNVHRELYQNECIGNRERAERIKWIDGVIAVCIQLSHDNQLVYGERRDALAPLESIIAKVPGYRRIVKTMRSCAPSGHINFQDFFSEQEIERFFADTRGSKESSAMTYAALLPYLEKLDVVFSLGLCYGVRVFDGTGGALLKYGYYLTYHSQWGRLSEFVGEDDNCSDYIVEPVAEGIADALGEDGAGWKDVYWSPFERALSKMPVRDRLLCCLKPYIEEGYDNKNANWRTSNRDIGAVFGIDFQRIAMELTEDEGDCAWQEARIRAQYHMVALSYGTEGVFQQAVDAMDEVVSQDQRFEDFMHLPQTKVTYNMELCRCFKEEVLCCLYQNALLEHFELSTEEEEHAMITQQADEIARLKRELAQERKKNDALEQGNAQLNKKLLRAEHERDDVNAQLTELTKQKETVHTSEEARRIYEAKDHEYAGMVERCIVLQAENVDLRARIEAGDERKLLRYGKVEELYASEIREFVLDAVQRDLVKAADGSRRKEILTDVLSANGYTGMIRKNAEVVKRALHDFDGMDIGTRYELASIGIDASYGSGHYKLCFQHDPRYVFTLSSTPSDMRAGRNMASIIVNNCF